MFRNGDLTKVKNLTLKYHIDNKLLIMYVNKTSCHHLSFSVFPVACEHHSTSIVFEIFHANNQILDRN